MRLAALISDCGLANYGPAKWAALSYDDWAALLRESVPHETIKQTLEGIARSLSNVQAANSLWLVRARETMKWFAGPHPQDRLGGLPEGVRDIIADYFKICVKEEYEDNDVHTRVYSYFVLSRREAWCGIMQAKVSDDEARIDWADRSIWRRRWSGDTCETVQPRSSRLLNADEQAKFERQLSIFASM